MWVYGTCTNDHLLRNIMNVGVWDLYKWPPIEERNECGCMGPVQMTTCGGTCARSDPTDRSGVPSFVGEDFYCESGYAGINYNNQIVWEDPLWDGEGCESSCNQCCTRYGWFHREIPTTSDNIEVRWCADEDQSNEDVFTYQLEIWVM